MQKTLLPTSPVLTGLRLVRCLDPCARTNPPRQRPPQPVYPQLRPHAPRRSARHLLPTRLHRIPVLIPQQTQRLHSFLAGGPAGNVEILRHTTWRPWAHRNLRRDFRLRIGDLLRLLWLFEVKIYATSRGVSNNNTSGIHIANNIP